MAQHLHDENGNSNHLCKEPSMSLMQQTNVRIMRLAPSTTSAFRRHNVDICCDSRLNLRMATIRAGLAAEALFVELEGLASGTNDSYIWPSARKGVLAEFKVIHNLDMLCQKLPECIHMSCRIEQDHNKSDTCPTNLVTTTHQANIDTDHLQRYSKSHTPSGELTTRATRNIDEQMQHI